VQGWLEDVDIKNSFPQGSWVGMGGDEFADEAFPGAQDLGFLHPLFQPELLHDLGQKLGGRMRPVGSWRVGWQTAPFGNDGAAKRRSHG